MVKQSNHLYLFGTFTLDVRERLLLNNDQPITLTPKAFETLVVLVKHNGHLVTKDELLKEVWPDSFVEEGNLSQNIYTLRKALGDGAGDHRYIETVPRKGYRFVSPVEEVLVKEEEQQPVEHIIQATKTELVPEVVELTAAVEPIPRNLPPKSSLTRRNIALAVLFIALLSAVSVLVLWPRVATWNTGQGASGSKSIAILPFKDISNEKSDEMLGLGMADATIVKLSNLQEVPVLPTSAVYKYVGLDNDPIAAGRELNVDAVLDGTVQHSGDRVRVSVRLLSLSQGKTLWAANFDEQFTNIFALQDSISEQVARALAIQITGEKRKQLSKRYTDNTEAYQAYLMGLYFWNKRTEEGLSNAVQYFQNAISRDPEYALAYAGLADSYGLIAYYKFETVPQDVAIEKCRTNAKKALELDSSIAEAHTALALSYNGKKGSTSEVEKSLKTAIALNPNYATARQRYAWYLVAWGRLDEGIGEMTRAHELDPLSLPINTALGNMYVFARKYDEAVQHFQRVLEMDPDNSLALYNLGLAYELKGDYYNAAAQYQRARQSDSNPTNSAEVLAQLYARMGRTVEAEKLLRELETPSKHRNPSPFSIALVYSALGRKEQAISWLDKAIADGSVQLVSLRYDPRLDKLRGDPLYSDLLRRHELSEMVPVASPLTAQAYQNPVVV